MVRGGDKGGSGGLSGQSLESSWGWGIYAPEPRLGHQDFACSMPGRDAIDDVNVGGDDDLERDSPSTPTGVSTFSSTIVGDSSVLASSSTAAAALPVEGYSTISRPPILIPFDFRLDKYIPFAVLA